MNLHAKSTKQMDIYMHNVVLSGKICNGRSHNNCDLLVILGGIMQKG